MRQQRQKHRERKEKDKERKIEREREKDRDKATEADRETDWLSPCRGDLVCATDCRGLGGRHCLTS